LVESKASSLIMKLYELYDGHRDSLLWLLEEFDAKSYEEYEQKYKGASRERCHFVTVCGFFELSGVLVNRRIIDSKLYFDIFNPSPFWHKAEPIVLGMREKRPHIYENFESLNEKRIIWANKRMKIKRRLE